jgi:hypothetical protein
MTCGAVVGPGSFGSPRLDAINCRFARARQALRLRPAGFAASRFGGSIAWCSRSTLSTIEVEVSVSRQKRETTSSRCATSITAISSTQLSSPVTL